MLRLVVIFVFIASLVIQSGLVSVYTVVGILQHKKEIKMRMKAELKKGLHNSKLEVFTEKDLSQAKWEHAKEFFLGVEKYDVVKVENTAHGKVYHCVNDKKELELYKSLDKNKKQKTLLDEVIKKFCFNSAHYGLERPLIRKVRIKPTVVYCNTYRFEHLTDLFRPPLA